MIFQELFPGRRELESAEIATELRSRAARFEADRPLVALNMVASVDGRARVDGRSGPLGGDADHALFHVLREQCDALVFGARTASIERYGRAIATAEARGRRAAAGRDPEPLSVCVSGELSISTEIPLLQEPEARVLIATRSGRELEGVRARVEYERLGSSELAPLFRKLKTEQRVDLTLCEGGPHLAGALLAEGLVDELFLTVAAMLAGTPPFPIVQGLEPDKPLDLSLDAALHARGCLFLRYGRG